MSQRMSDQGSSGPRTRAVAYFTACPVSSAAMRVFRRAAEESRQATLTTTDVLAAIGAADVTRWDRFFVGTAFAPPGWTATASEESARRPVELWIDLDVPYRVTDAVSLAVRLGERLAVVLDQPRLLPAHLMFGLLSTDCDASAYMASTAGMSRDELLASLGDRIFSGDLPSVTLDTPLPNGGWRSRSGDAEYGPPWDASTLACLRAAVEGARGAPLSTLHFLTSVMRNQPEVWTVMAEAGFALEPPDGRAQWETAGGTQEFDLGDRMGKIAATEVLAAALILGRDLAYFRGDASVTIAHVLYGVFDEPTGDGFRWLSRPDPDPGPRRVLEDAVFRESLPPRRLLTRSPAAITRRDRIADFVVPYWVFAVRAWSVLGRLWGLLCALIVLAAVVGGLGFLYTKIEPLAHPPATATALTRDLPVIRASVQYGSSAYPATFIGRLGGSYQPPAGPAVPAPALNGWFVFATAVPGGAAPQSQVDVRYQDGAYPATLYCPAWLRAHLCLAQAAMPRVRLPQSFGWLPWSLTTSNGAPGGGPALILSIVNGKPAAQTAQVTVTGGSSIGLPRLEVQGTDGAMPVAASPVVSPAPGLALRMIGITAEASTAGRYIVVPAAALQAYLNGLADAYALEAPSNAADDGMNPATEHTAKDGLPGVLIDKVQVGRAADLAGVLPGDHVLRFDGTALSNPRDLQQAVARCRPFQTVAVELERSGRKLTLSLRLGYVISQNADPSGG